jgi:hypothetical protein
MTIEEELILTKLTRLTKVEAVPFKVTGEAHESISNRAGLNFRGKDTFIQ